MLNLSDYTTPHSTWNGIYTYVKDHPALYQDVLADTFTEDELLKALKKQAQSLFLPKEYDAFRKSITALQKEISPESPEQRLLKHIYDNPYSCQ